MDYHSRIYITTAFFAGVILTLGFKDLYPDLERRFRRRQGFRSKPTSVSATAAAGLDENNNDDRSNSDRQIILEDHTQVAERRIQQQWGERGKHLISEGLEACVGDTPLFRIRSLSEETGREILVKAEVKLNLLVGLKILSLEYVSGSKISGKPKGVLTIGRFSF